MRLLSLMIPATFIVVLNCGAAVAQPVPSSADYWMPGCREAAALVHFSNDGEPSDLVKIGFCVGIIMASATQASRPAFAYPLA